MSKYQIEFKLKQHTPLIHFQHDQSGATLRATELKPKLDKFIIEKMGGKEKIPKTWWLNEEKGAMDYKVRVEAAGGVEYFLIFSFLNNGRVEEVKRYMKDFFPEEFNVICSSEYFANNPLIKFHRNSDTINEKDSCGEDTILAVMHKKINGTIKSLHPALINKIKEYIHELFASINFGTRQSKGFGCFTVEEVNKQRIDKPKNNYEAFFRKYFQYAVKQDIKSNEIENICQKIDNIYKNIKNMQNEDSIIKQVFQNQNIEWDKEVVKKYLLNNKEKPPKVFPDNQSPAFVRAMLGLAGNISVPQKNITVNIEHVPKKDKSKIERFRSPILFKVYENTIYILAPSDEDAQLNRIEDETFVFFKNHKNYKETKDKIFLKTPSEMYWKELFEMLMNKGWENV